MNSETASLTDQTLGAFLAALAAPTPTPGGGAAAAVTAALGAALVAMAARLSAAGSVADAHGSGLHDLAQRADVLRGELAHLAEADSAAFAAVIAARRLPRAAAERPAALQAAWQAATEAPLAVAAACVEVLALAAQAARQGRTAVIGDAAMAALLAEAALRGSVRNAALNARNLADAALRDSVGRRGAALAATGAAALL
jgi:formiminotetrahydrofolate cyclodeaminase